MSYGRYFMYFRMRIFDQSNTPCFVLMKHTDQIFIVLFQRNNSLQEGTSSRLDTLFWLLQTNLLAISCTSVCCILGGHVKPNFIFDETHDFQYSEVFWVLGRFMVYTDSKLNWNLYIGASNHVLKKKKETGCQFILSFFKRANWTPLKYILLELRTCALVG